MPKSFFEISTVQSLLLMKLFEQSMPVKLVVAHTQAKSIKVQNVASSSNEEDDEAGCLDQ
jgi:hypothetical protein